MLSIAAYGRACTVCGSSSGNQNLGILPQYNKHFAGIQYQFRGFQSEHPPHESQGAPEFSKESFSTLQVWGRCNVGKRIQLFAFVPYISNIQKANSTTTSVSGVGDITLMINYKINRNNELRGGWNHNLQAGGGIKLPTGQYDKSAIRRSEGLPNMQPGTNSWDFVTNANYILRKEKAGLNLDLSYTISTPNTLKYKFGNRLSSGLTCFYWHQKGQYTLMPQAGVRVDLAGSDYDNYTYKWKNDMSGGSQIFATVGLQSYYKRVGVQFMYHLPVAQHYASGLVNNTGKLDAGVLLLF